ncbi:MULTISPECIES: tetratricopeptide repeat protein [unclassified Polaribacter]|uniref:tetratricopeptide repeat protein n=1 Tax=unclassified Polaribacter TaxID=196858 RepID=UPI0011BD4FFE|nr:MULTISPECIES: hypothetical protein [unclassified Polaribacter]TXD47387.1 hypothetical protein ES043_18245 [Polaribacter sp. IC063]TXD55732.1 hypothetical protein ES044_17715 [Polaribacter sp. IC066]
MKKAFILFLITIFTINVNAQKDSLSLTKLQSKQIELENKISQVRQNQLNYKIEKDLLKETYSTNYERIQSIITLILGVFTVLGFLGIRSIWNLKKNYETELNDLRTLKTEFENDYNNLIGKQNTLDKKIEAIDSINQEQDLKLKILDIREKTDDLISKRQYLQALEYITVGLEIDSKNTDLKHSKAFIFYRLRKYKESIKLHREILKIEPKNTTSLFDLAELLLIIKHNEEFKEFRSSNENELGLDSENPITIYLDGLYNYNIQKTDLLENNISTILNSMETDERKKHLEWDFADLRFAIKDEENNSLKEKIVGFTNLLSGTWTKKKYLESIN